mmetsp:Transcript_3891/g.7490  ORF Transcript_3891/g.7490 Transcript_3891/m.7490 type:complete len:86 (+) Transcript_3891:2780-3037(+)
MASFHREGNKEAGCQKRRMYGQNFQMVRAPDASCHDESDKECERVELDTLEEKYASYYSPYYKHDVYVVAEEVPIDDAEFDSNHP